MYKKFNLNILFLLGILICALIHLNAQSNGNYELKCWMECLIVFQMIGCYYLDIKKSIK